MENSSVPIHLTSGKLLVWKCDDACRLRENHRILGTLVGCLTRCPRQNQHLGLPLQLMPEEAALLINKGIGRLVDGNASPKERSAEDVKHFEEHRQKCYEEQVKWGREDRKNQMQSLRESILRSKKAKLNKAKEKEVDEDTLQREVDQILERKIPPLPRKHSIVQIHTVTPDYLAQREVSPAWSYPQTPAERLRCRVFSDLWERGHCIQPGGKFGGTFLVYPGDPARFHSFYIAVVLPPDERLGVDDIAALSRLGSSVKKTVLVCSEDAQGDLSYLSLQWTGIS